MSRDPELPGSERRRVGDYGCAQLGGKLSRSDSELEGGWPCPPHLRRRPPPEDPRSLDEIMAEVVRRFEERGR